MTAIKLYYYCCDDVVLDYCNICNLLIFLTVIFIFILINGQIIEQLYAQFINIKTTEQYVIIDLKELFITDLLQNITAIEHKLLCFKSFITE